MHAEPGSILLSERTRSSLQFREALALSRELGREVREGAGYFMVRRYRGRPITVHINEGMVKYIESSNGWIKNPTVKDLEKELQ